ncbi:unnamed protein product [Caenorhabditis angaria]|uniref:CUB-like domain-containing protein n=1 Tax=Caenorhabditis angaria TaxID=860376 RepID=A0A9P1IMZ1_9PELO|nr:unnamed protein product [Caenorhabditis angaria]
MLSFLFVLIFSASFVAPDNLSCPSNPIAYSKPADTNTIFHYPNTSNQIFNHGNTCEFNFNVPYGYAISLTFSTNGSATVIDSNKISKIYESNDNNLVFLLSPGGSLQFNTIGEISYFNMTFQYFTIYPEYQFNINISASSRDPFSSNSIFEYPTVITSDTRISLITIPTIDAPLPDLSEYVQQLKATVIFDGPNINSSYIGSLYDQYFSENQLVSTGKSLTIVTIGNPNPNLRDIATIVLQDYSLTSKYNPYFGVALKNNHDIRNVQINLGTNNQAAAFLTIMGTRMAEYLMSTDLNQGKIDVYIGSTFDENLIASYDKDNVKNSLPQEILGIHRTYVISGNSEGHVSLNLTRSSEASGFSNAFIGRKGFLASRYYKSPQVLSIDESADYLNSNLSLNFNLDIKHVDLTGNSSLYVNAAFFNKDTANLCFNRTNLAPANLIVPGSKLQVYYVTDLNTTGFYLDYQITDNKSVGLPAIFTIFIVILNIMN